MRNLFHLGALGLDGSIEQRQAVELPARFDLQIQTWDMSFKGTSNADYVVGQVHAAHGADRYLLDQVRDRLDLPGTLQAVRRLSARWPNATLKLVEDKANGPAVIQSLRHEIPGIRKRISSQTGSDADTSWCS